MYMGLMLFIGSKVPCLFCFEIFTPEGKGGEKGGSANFKTKHTECLTQEIPSALYQVSAATGHTLQVMTLGHPNK